jgi:aryl-alcohol dehydrogenase-like predicted oxidoreductase
MEMRRLGPDHKIAPLMLGGNVFGWTADEPTSFRILDAFLDAGFNAIDTADSYSSFAPGHKGGESETVLGNWMAARKNRSKVVMATKCAMLAPHKGLSKTSILSAVEDSLRRLKTDYIDLYQAHYDDEGTPQEETLGAFDQLIRQGKVRAIGASNFTGARLKSALDISRKKKLASYVTLQPHYNLIDRAGFEGDQQPVCVAEKIAVIPYFSLASGFLTGKYRSADDKKKSPRGGGMDKYLNPRGLRILAALDEVSARHKASQAQVALAWLLTRPAVAAPIASATSVAQLTDILGAVRLKLSAEDLAALDKASAP